MTLFMCYVLYYIVDETGSKPNWVVIHIINSQSLKTFICKYRVKAGIGAGFQLLLSKISGYDGTGRRSRLKICWQKCRMDSNSIIRIRF